MEWIVPGIKRMSLSSCMLLAATSFPLTCTPCLLQFGGGREEHAPPAPKSCIPCAPLMCRSTSDLSLLAYIEFFPNYWITMTVGLVRTSHILNKIYTYIVCVCVERERESLITSKGSMKIRQTRRQYSKMLSLRACLYINRHTYLLGL